MRALSVEKQYCCAPGTLYFARKRLSDRFGPTSSVCHGRYKFSYRVPFEADDGFL